MQTLPVGKCFILTFNVDVFFNQNAAVVAISVDADSGSVLLHLSYEG